MGVVIFEGVLLPSFVISYVFCTGSCACGSRLLDGTFNSLYSFSGNVCNIQEGLGWL